MEAAQILAEIAASPALQALAAARNHGEIARVLSIGRKKLETKLISARGMASTYPGGPFAGEVVLMKLEGARDSMMASTDPETQVFGSLLRRQLGFLDTEEGLDFGDATMQAIFFQFAAMNILTADEADKLQSMALVPDSVSAIDVEAALREPTTSNWAGHVASSQLREGMVYVTIAYTSSVAGVEPKIEQTWGDDLTPERVQAIIAARCESLAKADAALALFAG